jgi:hypothetical protein
MSPSRYLLKPRFGSADAEASDRLRNHRANARAGRWPTAAAAGLADARADAAWPIRKAEREPSLSLIR